MTEVSLPHRITAERLSLLGWPRAILLQFAHPLIAAGVHDHSGFQASPMAAASRLHQTVAAMLTLTYGDAPARARTIDRIRTIHARVNGTLGAGVGVFPAGTRYSAEDPTLVLWVHATVIESTLLIYERLRAPLTTSERDAYCAEAAWVAVALGAADSQVPRTWAAMSDYIGETTSSGVLCVGPQARALCRALLWPSLFSLLPGSGWLNRILTIDMLPLGIREQYGLRLTAGDEGIARALFTAIRLLRRITPAPLALWPASRRETAAEHGATRRLHAQKPAG